jgi:hypothetical protein
MEGSRRGMTMTLKVSWVYYPELWILLVGQILGGMNILFAAAECWGNHLWGFRCNRSPARVKGPWYQLVSPKKHEELLKSTYRERTKKTNDPSTTRKYMYVHIIKATMVVWWSFQHSLINPSLIKWRLSAFVSPFTFLLPTWSLVGLDTLVGDHCKPDTFMVGEKDPESRCICYIHRRAFKASSSNMRPSLALPKGLMISQCVGSSWHYCNQKTARKSCHLNNGWCLRHPCLELTYLGRY